MKRANLSFAVALLVVGGCASKNQGTGADRATTSTSPISGASSSITGGSTSTSTNSASTTSLATSAATSSSQISEMEWDGAVLTTVAMPRISSDEYSGVDGGGVPAFASSTSDYQTVASSADDDNPLTSWVPTGLPAWIAYDLSIVPVGLRQNALVVWNALHTGTYLNTTIPTGSDMPTAYTIEGNSAPGGTSAPPSDGWVQLAAVSNNLRNTVESPVNLAGANWVRMSITGASDPIVALDLDVFSTPNGATDAWMFLGDSITYITMGYAFSDLPQLVHQARPDRWPAIVNAALGGTNTQTAVAVIDSTMAGFPGRYVVLAYGTNDDPTMFEMGTLVQHVISAGKIPVVPTMPWSDSPTIATNGPLINAAIKALYTQYPQIVPGPDLWTAFLNRTDLIPSGDIHPNQAGQEYLRQQWATMMATIP